VQPGEFLVIAGEDGGAWCEPHAVSPRPTASRPRRAHRPPRRRLSRSAVHLAAPPADRPPWRGAGRGPIDSWDGGASTGRRTQRASCDPRSGGSYAERRTEHRPQDAGQAARRPRATPSLT
jgi:hypothetical protein